ncbi:hypothetical protein HYT55_03495 [Candidatus Woesearchaeota archaeon]|nr:hypothetical protein [Candidatus Woesearchaeota archaeon]
MVKTIFFFSQDPGSANALFPVIKKIQERKWLFNVFVFATRQSKEIFRGEGIDFTDLDVHHFSPENFPSPALIIVGASAGLCPEKSAILFGKERGIPTLSILDFWSNYSSRYSEKENDFAYLPDFVLVMDQNARDQMIELGFSQKKVIVTGNPFFDTFKLASVQNDTRDILYVSQPEVKEGKYSPNYTLLKDILDVKKELNIPSSLIIRPHPKEDCNAYNEYCTSDIVVDCTSSIRSLLQKSSIVIGRHSMVLFEAVFSGKLVLSYQPENESVDRLITNMMGLSYCARSKEELIVLFKKATSGELKKKEIGIVPYLNDGKCTERVVAEIEKMLVLFT